MFIFSFDSIFVWRSAFVCLCTFIAPKLSCKSARNFNMENIAALSASLREKDAEKSVIADAIKGFEYLKKQSIIGKLRLVITGITDAKNTDISSNCQFDVNICAGAGEFSSKVVCILCSFSI